MVPNGTSIILSKHLNGVQEHPLLNHCCPTQTLWLQVIVDTQCGEAFCKSPHTLGIIDRNSNLIGGITGIQSGDGNIVPCKTISYN